MVNEEKTKYICLNRQNRRDRIGQRWLSTHITSKEGNLLRRDDHHGQQWYRGDKRDNSDGK